MGFFGVLGSGNLGNDGSLDAVVAFLRDRHPTAELGFLCIGPEQISARYGAPAQHLLWYDAHIGSASGPVEPVLKALGKALDAFRTLRWTRRHDVVIVPGMGVLEASIPTPVWGFPYALLSLCVSGRLTGTKVALVSVGADIVRNRATRWVLLRAARLSHYRSYRDAFSREAMRRMGIDVIADEIYPDLAFALPAPSNGSHAPSTTGGPVGVGVMDYHGDDDDRAQCAEIHRAYVDTVKRFVRWLVDDGRAVRLFTGDRVDDGVVAEILADVQTHRPGLDPSRVVVETASSLEDLMERMATVETVVATRYHNVLCALRSNTPTLSISYAAKNDVLMADMGLGEFCQPARSVDFDLLVEQFRALESKRDQLVETLAQRNRAKSLAVERQFAALSAAILEADSPVLPPGPPSAGARAEADGRP